MSFEEVYEDLMNNRFKRFLNQPERGSSIVESALHTRNRQQNRARKSTSEMKDITDVLDEIVVTWWPGRSIFRWPLLKGDVSDVGKSDAKLS